MFPIIENDYCFRLAKVNHPLYHSMVPVYLEYYVLVCYALHHFCLFCACLLFKQILDSSKNCEIALLDQFYNQNGE